MNDLEMEYLTCTSELTPMMIHLRVNTDGKIMYRISGLLENEDPNIYYLLDTFHLHPDLCPPIYLSPDSSDKYLQDITVWHSVENAFYLFDNVAYSIHFPLKWVIYENYTNSKKNKKNTFGPKVCKICDKYGYQDLIFIGYCGDCSEKCRKKEMKEMHILHSNSTNKIMN